MLIRRRHGWELPETAATPEHVFHRRRQLIKGIAAGPILLAGARPRGAAMADDADAGGRSQRQAVSGASQRATGRSATRAW